MSLTRSDARDLANLPWRGKVTLRSVRPDTPDELLPVKRGKYQIKTFDLSSTVEAAEAAEILEQAEFQAAEVFHSEIQFSEGCFRLLLVWRCLYMCDVDYLPTEISNVLASDDIGPDMIFPGENGKETIVNRGAGTQDIDLKSLLMTLDRDPSEDEPPVGVALVDSILNTSELPGAVEKIPETETVPDLDEAPIIFNDDLPLEEISEETDESKSEE